MRKCRICGFPRRFAGFLEWHSDGTLIGSLKPRIPVMFLEVSEWDSIFGELSGTLGISIDHIVIKAQKNIGKGVYEMMKTEHMRFDIKRIPNSRILRPGWLAKAALWVSRNDFAGLGAGRPHIVGYRAGESMTLRFTDPCLNPMIVGNSLGVYESIERMPGSRAEYSLENGDLVIHMTPSGMKDESEERLYLEEVIPGTGILNFDRCPLCNVPMEFAGAIEWDIERGIIRNPLTGERLEVMAVQSVNAVLRELESELGEEIVQILYDAQKRFSLDKLEGQRTKDPGSFWEGYLGGMALNGLGYPERFEETGGSVSVEILNAYNRDLYAARISAGVEKIAGRRSRIEWDRKERHHSKYRITA
jgi:hypothetical protein